MLEKKKVGVIFFFSVTKILHATNLMEVKQEYLLIKDDNDICNQKLKFDVSKIERLFYQFRYYFKNFVFQVDRLV